MFGIAFKIFGALFPFLQEIFIGKKTKRGKKTPSFFAATWVKKTLIGLGLICFILTGCLGKLYYDAKYEINMMRDKQEKVVNKPVNKEVPTAPPPPLPPEKIEYTPESTTVDTSPTRDMYPRSRRAVKIIKQKTPIYHPREDEQSDLIKQIDAINDLGDNK